MGLFKDRGDRPRLLGRGHERRDDRRDDPGDRREDRRDNRGDGEKTAKTAVRARPPAEIARRPHFVPLLMTPPDTE